MTIERAVCGWIATATGLAASGAQARILWAGQGRTLARPAGAGSWVSVAELGEEAGGPDWIRQEPYPLTFADLVVSVVNAAADTLTVVGHGRATGDGPVDLVTTGTLPGGLTEAVPRWLIRVDNDTVRLAASFEDAIDGIAVDVTSSGTGTLSIVDRADTVRAGAEIVSTTRGTRAVTIRLTAFGGGATGATKPRAVLDRIRAAAALEGVQEAARAEGCAIASCGPSTDVSAAIAGVDFEPRATMDVRLHLSATALTETLTRIDTVVATQTEPA